MKFETCYRSGFAAILCMAWVMPPAHALNDLHVDQGNANCPGTGTSADPFCAIQDAVDASVDGDVIHVAPGHYFEHLIVEMRDISLLSTDGPLSTIVDAGGAGSALLFRNANGTTPVVEGFTFRGGTGTLGRGGGVYIDGASPTLRECIVTCNHTPGRGGGVYASNLSTTTFVGCEVFQNSTETDGGGIFQSGGSLALTGCTVHLNVAEDNGGGLHLRNNATLSLMGCETSWNTTLFGDGAGAYLSGSEFQVTKSHFKRNFSGRHGSGLALHNSSSGVLCEVQIKGNRTVMDGSGVHINSSVVTLDRTHLIQNSCGRNGGGMCAINNAEVTITQGFFRRNHSKGYHGGGIYLDSVNALQIHTCKFLTNIARFDGGGVYAVNCSNSRFDYCAFGKNGANNGRGGAFHLISSSPEFDHCSFTLNVGNLESCAIYGRNLSMPVIKNSIMWGDIGAELILIEGHKPPGTGSNTTSITYTDIEGMWPGANNFDADPLFIAPHSGNYHLRSDSPVRGMADDGSDLGAYPYGS